QNNKLDMAYTLYDQVWYRKQKTDAQLARMAVAQRIFDQKCFLAEQGIAFSNFSEAKIHLDDAQLYLTKHPQDHIDGARLVGLKLNWQSDYAQSLYKAAKDALLKRNYSEAKSNATQCTQVMGSRAFDFDKEVAYILIACELAPKYLKGLELLGQREYREAYAKFNEVKQEDSKFRWDGKESVSSYMDSCIQRGAFSVNLRAYSKLGDLDLLDGIDNQLYAAVQGAIFSDPFVALVESDQMELLVEELRLYLEPTFNQENGGPEAGKFLKSEYLLVAEIAKYEFFEDEELPGTRKECPCSKIKDVSVNRERSSCFEKGIENRLDVQLHFKLIEMESARVVLAGNFKRDHASGSFTSQGSMFEVAPKTGQPLLKNVKNKIKKAMELIVGSDGTVSQGEYINIQPKGEQELRMMAFESFAQYLAGELAKFAPKK
ncbi:MAG: hypothetical protein ACKO66_01300, partial [Flavobacteriales bacterium]